MNNQFSKNIIKLRKANKLTQENLASKLGVSFQAISKWETGQTYPDIELLPQIATIFHINIDSLLGYIPQKIKMTEYEKRYEADDYYWGIEPSQMCYEIMKIKPSIKPLRLLDIGCGEGKDAVFFAKNGYIVSAFDIADAGLDKAKKLAEMHNVNVNFFKANVCDYRLDNEFDIIFSSGVLHYIPDELRKEFFENIKNHTSLNGLHSLNVFVKKPFILIPPDAEPTDTIWKSGELFSYYFDWYLHQSQEIVFDCNSSGIPHKHCMNVLLAEKVGF